MQRATLALITRGKGENEEVLLSVKKEAEIGTGTINGPGGKVDPGETPLQCVVRETDDEMGITLDPKNLRLVAILELFTKGEPYMEVFIYRTRTFTGEPCETTSMLPPQWYKVNNLPLEQMLEGDRAWFERIIKAPLGPVMGISVFYKERVKNFERIEFYPLP